MKNMIITTLLTRRVRQREREKLYIHNAQKKQSENNLNIYHTENIIHELQASKCYYYEKNRLLLGTRKGRKKYDDLMFNNGKINMRSTPLKHINF